MAFFKGQTVWPKQKTVRCEVKMFSKPKSPLRARCSVSRRRAIDFVVGIDQSNFNTLSIQVLENPTRRDCRLQEVRRTKAR